MSESRRRRYVTISSLLQEHLRLVSSVPASHWRFMNRDCSNLEVLYSRYGNEQITIIFYESIIIKRKKKQKKNKKQQKTGKRGNRNFTEMCPLSTDGCEFVFRMWVSPVRLSAELLIADPSELRTLLPDAFRLLGLDCHPFVLVLRLSC